MRPLFVLLVLHSVLGAVGTSHAEIIERIIVKVNGEIITLSQFHERQIAAAQAARVPPEQISTFLRQNNARILQQAIDEVLLLQKAEDSGLQLPTEFVDEIIESIKKDNNITTEEEFQAALAQEGMTLDELRESIRKSYTRQMIVRRDVEPRISVSEDQVLEEYEKRKDTDFTTSATVTLQEIFIPEDAGGITRAREIVERARAGEDFASLARTHSAGPTASTGGELGEIAQGDLNPVLEETAFALPVGSVSDPILVEGGHRILRVLAKTSGSVVPFAQAKPRIRNEMMGARFDEEYKVYIAEVREKADIELRVREVPLQLSGAVPEDSLFNVDPFSLGPAGPGATPGSVPPSASAPGGSVPATPNPFAAPGPDDEFVTTPQARPERVTPGAIGDEITTTPQAGPERVAPPVSPSPDPPAETTSPPE
jgi:peptidyl-prolyl cis-trans isomerase SurA